MKGKNNMNNNVINLFNKKIENKNNFGWIPSFTSAELKPCIVQSIPLMRGDGLCVQMIDNCFIFDGMVFEALINGDFTENNVKDGIEYNDGDRYVATINYEYGKHYVREDGFISLFRIVYEQSYFNEKCYDYGIFVDKKCGFYNPVNEVFTLSPQFDYICWWEDETGRELAFAANGCTFNGVPAIGFTEMIDEKNYPTGGDWYDVKTVPGGTKIVTPMKCPDVLDILLKKR